MIRKLLTLATLTMGLTFAAGPVYELRTYTTAEGKLEALKARFRDHTIRIFNKYGMESVGYWVPEDPEKSKNTLIYILKHPSREAADKAWTAFAADPEWQKVARESGVGQVNVERVFMDPAEFSKLK
jgi:hypothetical protein